jgi:NDP-sugar pyrophosphorylase family protein
MPMIDHIINGAVAAGVDEISLIVGYMGEMIRAHVGDGSRYNAAISFIDQLEPGGTGDALMYAEQVVGDQPFFLSWGDIIVAPESYHGVVERFAAGDCDCVLAANWIADPYEGAAVYDRDGYLDRIEEKPPKGTATTEYNNAGIFILSPQIFPMLRQIPLSSRGELEVPSAIMRMLEGGSTIAVHKLSGYWNDVARPTNIISLQATMIAHLATDQTIIAADACVDPGARLEPPLYIGPGTQIGAAHIGPNVVLGSGCTVAEGSTITNATCFDGSSCGSNALVEYAILQERVTLGCGHQMIGYENAPACLYRD